MAGDVVRTSDKVKYLGVWLDNTLSMEHHIQARIKAAAHGIRSIAQIRKFIDLETAKLLAVSLVLCHLDYANSVLYALPKRTIQKLQEFKTGLPRSS